MSSTCKQTNMYRFFTQLIEKNFRFVAFLRIKMHNYSVCRKNLLVGSVIWLKAHSSVRIVVPKYISNEKNYTV